MSIVVLVEQVQGKFKKKSFEAVQYAAHIAQAMSMQVVAVALGTVANEELQVLGQYGANKVLHVNDFRLDGFSARAYAKCVINAAKQENAKIIIAVNDATGKAVAPRVAANLMAGIVAGVISYPDTTNGFVVKRGVFSGKAFANVNITSDIKVLTLMPNTFSLQAGSGVAVVENLETPFDEKDFSIKIQDVSRATGTVPLSEAELVVSGGRGMKGPENWYVLEDLAKELGAALACSRPVADAHWRPHHEHVGQTGGTIRPNLYIAVGISGAIQHLAGVNGSKTIVVINKDPEAPFFSAATYGVLGDAMTVVPQLTEAIKRYKQNN